MAAVMIGSLFNNLRMGGIHLGISDASRRLDDMRDVLRQEMARNRGEVLQKIGDLDVRSRRIEKRR